MVVIRYTKPELETQAQRLRVIRGGQVQCCAQDPDPDLALSPRSRDSFADPMTRMLPSIAP